MTDAIMVTTTFDSAEKAGAMARLLVENRLAACVQVIAPVASTYRWQGEIETSQEWLALIKTRRPHFEELKKVIMENHTYEVPEILSFPVEAGTKSYLNWMTSETEHRPNP